MHFRRGLRDWWSDLQKVAAKTRGIERAVGIALWGLRLAAPTEWVHLGFGTKDRHLYFSTDTYVFGVLLVSAWIYSCPNVWLVPGIRAG